MNAAVDLSWTQSPTSVPQLRVLISNRGTIPFTVDRDLTFLVSITALGDDGSELAVQWGKIREASDVRDRLVSVRPECSLELGVDVTKPLRKFIVGVGSDWESRPVDVMVHEAEFALPKGTRRLRVVFEEECYDDFRWGFFAYTGLDSTKVGFLEGEPTAEIDVPESVQKQLGKPRLDTPR